MFPSLSCPVCSSVGSDVYVLLMGHFAFGHEIRLRTQARKVISQQATGTANFVAHFQGDGTYAGAVRHDLPFNPQQLGVFPNGDFLIAGAAPGRTSLAWPSLVPTDNSA